MNSKSDGRRRVLAGVALALAVCAALVGGGIAAHNLLAEENAQAHAFLDEGQRAEARGDRGASVLALERARWLAPRAEAVRSALAAAAVQDVEPVVARTFRLVTSREWAALAMAAGWVTGLGIAFGVTRRRSARWVALTASAVFVVAMAGVVESSARSIAIVTGSDARVWVAPYPMAPPEGSLSTGTMVIVGSAYDDFVRVESPDGLKGWARRSSVEAIASPEG